MLKVVTIATILLLIRTLALLGIWNWILLDLVPGLKPMGFLAGCATAILLEFAILKYEDNS